MTQACDRENSMTIGGSPVSLRRDLQVVTIRRGLQVTYVIKDPVNLKYFEFDEHEMALIEQLDTGQSWEQICQWFDRRFPPLRLTHQALQAMIWRLYQQGLIVTVAAGQGLAVAARVRKQRRQALLQSLSQPWAIRLGGIHPGPLIAVTNTLFGWIFSPLFVVLASICLGLILAFIAAEYHSILQMRPGTVDFFSRENLLSFTVIIILTKIAHELGHATASYRRGIECHEMGILLLAGLPSLYCDVSDAWTLPRRWQRITVSLAGIWVEVLIAAIAFVVWSTSIPGVIHAISFNVMVVCSLGTILFNANPLVRYDGYYVLMDLTGVSNLEQRSKEVLARLFMRWTLGSPEMRPLDAIEIPRWCLFYAVASTIYRVFLTGAILWGLHLALKPFSLSIVVWTLASVGLTIWGGKMIRNSSDQVRRAYHHGTPAWRIGLGLIALSGLVIWGMLIPLPWYVFGDALMEPEDQRTIVAAVPGRLLERKDSGIIVESGDVIARLENRTNQQEIRKLESELNSQEKHLQTLLARRNQDPRASEQIPRAEAAVAAVSHRLQFLHEERQRLDLLAGQTAVIYRAPNRSEKNIENDLENWSGSLLDPMNCDAWVAAGDPVCQVGSMDRMQAVAVLAQDDLEAVAVGHQVDILLKASGRMIRGEITRISGVELDDKDESTIGLALPKTTDQNGRGKLHNKWYQVQIRCLSPVPEGTMVRSRSKVRIHAGKRSFGNWVAIQFFKTFRWHA